jgi:hypothetical protein
MGEDCDLTTAWMAGQAEARDSFKARLEEAKAREGLARIDAEHQRARAEALERKWTEAFNRNAALLERAEAAEAALAAMTQERDEANEVIDKQGALLADAYGAIMDWDEVLKDRADHECKARLAKAVEALREIAGMYSEKIWAGSVARSTLAEIEGEA